MTLRRIPSDFAVEEVLTKTALDAIASEPGPGALFGVYRLTKTSLSTPEAIARLARANNVRPGDMSSAGLKDKHAVTIQHVSVRCANALRALDLPPTISESNWSAELLGFAPSEARADWIAANRFTITVRDLTPANIETMDKRLEQLLGSHPAAHATSPHLVLPNYFGDQRFGSARHHQGFAARRLIDGDFEGALKLLIGTPARKDVGARRTFTRACAQSWGEWARLARELPDIPERRAVELLARGGSFRDAFAALPYFTQQMCVEAYQSYLWNAIVRRLMQETFPPDQLVSAADPFGKLLFPVVPRIPREWSYLDLTLPAWDSQPPPELTGVVATALSEENLTLDRLKISELRRPSFASSPRPLLLIVDQLVMGAGLNDDLSPRRRSKRQLQFELQRGGYATVVLRALS